MNKALLLLPAALLITTACETVESSDLRTSGMKAHITVVAKRDGATIGVDLSAGSFTDVKLNTGDKLEASAAGHSIRLKHGNFLGFDSYGARLDGVSKPGETVTVSLERDGETPAPNSTVKLPDAVKIASPHNQSTVPRGRDLQFRVNKDDDDFRVSWQGSCVNAGSSEGLIVGAGALVSLTPPSEGPATPKQCLVTFEVSRIEKGELDPAYKSGYITAERTATVVVRSVP